ncbi:DUF4179 domain-containing protein [Paenibacillus sp. MMS20-IR301]|uniref:DUF4179 domain-containing protein n=1 Tax=Paenibacillus sp. MMS20-IR301 TaxID=2895946 RepID=UPI0028E399E8|nr:DUF4179 domain-containing protein [Paenibacillus sp. MMS20-IR301]WNS43745.1 DUF4179 domain-containing protein [Paenibacillus sp. MMS20-IR301]
MNNLEDVLKRQLNDDKTLTYPDFEQMWKRLGVNDAAGPVQVDAEGPAATGYRRKRSWQRVAVLASLSVLLAAAPVYAAIHYNWDGLLSGRSGVQAALAQNLGQPLEQSLTYDGLTLKLHTAIVDENRTVILYTLDVGAKDEAALWNVTDMQLQDQQGKVYDEGFSYLQWDEGNGWYNGYFESEWTPQQDNVQITLKAAAVEAFSSHQQALPLDSGSAAAQVFRIGDEGMQSIEVKPFAQNQNKLLLSSAVTFDQPEAKAWTHPEIVAYNGATKVSGLAGGTFGTPGDNGEYTMQQYFRDSDIVSGQTTYALQYTKLEQHVTGPWAFDLQLSKQQMEGGTVKRVLNIPLETGDTLNTIEEMIITPSQIRLNVRVGGKSFKHDLPYKQYSLLVNGQSLEGHFWGSSADDRDVMKLKFERPEGLVIDEDTPVTFLGKYKVTIHDEDKEPLLLRDISSEKQTVMRETGGYPVKWTYYMQGKDLYVETESEDIHFGGVNQTYIGTGKDRLIGKKVTVNFSGDGNNHSIDVYKDFQGTEASAYMFYYSTNAPGQETRVVLQP